MKKILVTGSNGLLGQKLTDKLRNNTSYQLIATSKGTDRYPDPQGYTYESFDISNENEWAFVLTKYKPDVVIHTAAMTNVDACEKDQENCRKLNVDAVNYLVKFAKMYGFYIIHLSTDFIFDGENGPYKEEDNANPLSYYGYSKWESENILLSSNCNYAILRTIIVYGVVANMSRSNIVLWAKSALEKGEEIQVVDDQFRMPTLAEDLAEACILAAEKQPKGVFHVAGKDYMSILEMVYRIADFFGLNKNLIKPISSTSLNQPAKRPAKTGFILKKAMDQLNYHPHAFEEGLAIIKKQLHQ